MQGWNSVEIERKVLEQKVRKKIQKMALIRKRYENCTKVPVWLQISYRKQQKPFVIDPDRTFHEFRESVKAYLLYNKEHSEKGYFFNMKTLDCKFTLTNANIQMGQLFDKYKTSLGWVEIQIKEQSIF